MKLLLKFLILIYLLGQSIGDIKTKTVRTGVNNFFVILSIIIYSTECFLLSSFPPIAVPLSVVLFYIMSYKLHLFGTGDAKAFFIIYLISRYIGNTTHPDFFLFLIFLLIAEVSCFLWCLVIRIKAHKKEERVAFFPHMTIGYLGMWLYGSLLI